MKKLATILMLFVVIGMIVSCEKKATPEEEVRNYGEYFVEKVNANQLDSLKSSYPAIAKADSIVSVKSDTIMVMESTPGQYDMTLAEGITLKVSRSDDGSISVTESKGLFAFPADKVDIAKKTGMWDDNLSDAQLNERMKDEEFFKYIQDQNKKKTSNIIKIGKFIETPAEVWDPSNDGIGYQILINQTNTPISGSEYTIIKERYAGGAGADPSEWIESSKGQDLDANSTIRIKSWQGMHFGSIITSIKWNLTPQELQEKFASFTGNEYQEYLDSKK